VVEEGAVKVPSSPITSFSRRIYLGFLEATCFGSWKIVDN